MKTNGDVWTERRALNAGVALPYQWERYEEVGTVENFRIAAGLANGVRRGFFYTDSDLHKWAEAAARTLGQVRDAALESRLAEYVSLMGAAQEEDGYLYTFNQIQFPHIRWKNFQIEHELYCMGHFIEAGIAHPPLLPLATKTADLICLTFDPPRPNQTPGHQEIEIALARLHRLTGKKRYLRAARAFLSARGRMVSPGANLLSEYLSHGRRMKECGAVGAGYDFTETTTKDEPALLGIRTAASFLSGTYQQQHRPVKRQVEPRGHAVRWTYQRTAEAMTAHGKHLGVLEASWTSLVDRKMYVTGGIGSLPMTEGFGRKWELNDRFAYCETCAAIGSIFWNREMAAATGRARYADLLEWQLYNAAAVGIGMDGRSYFYRNPLESAGGIGRHPWFDTACCPSNLSRLWADLDSYVLQVDRTAVRIGQYVTGEYSAGALRVSIQTEMPWEGRILITVENSGPEVMLLLRIPGWAAQGAFRVDEGSPHRIARELPKTFGASVFEEARWLPVAASAGGRTAIDMNLEMDVRPLRAHPNVRGHRGKVALTRGPLVWCLEEVDNPILAEAAVDPAAVAYRHRADLLGGIGTLEAADLTFVPYYAWGNRRQGAMSVWVKVR